MLSSFDRKLTPLKISNSPVESEATPFSSQLQQFGSSGSQNHELNYLVRGYSELQEVPQPGPLVSDVVHQSIVPSSAPIPLIGPVPFDDGEMINATSHQNVQFHTPINQPLKALLHLNTADSHLAQNISSDKQSFAFSQCKSNSNMSLVYKERGDCKPHCLASTWTDSSSEIYPEPSATYGDWELHLDSNFAVKFAIFYSFILFFRLLVEMIYMMIACFVALLLSRKNWRIAVGASSRMVHIGFIWLLILFSGQFILFQKPFRLRLLHPPLQLPPKLKIFHRAIAAFLRLVTLSLMLYALNFALDSDSLSLK